MAKDVAEFYDLVSAAINRGTTYDSIIPTYVARAVRFLEQNYSFEYMKVTDSDFYGLTAGERVYEQPENLKKIHLWRVIKANGKYLDLEKVDPADLGATTDPTANESPVPSTFYLEGRLYMILNVEPDQDYNNAELWHEVFTDWSDVDAGDAPWLVVNAENLLLNQTVILMGTRLRDPKLIALHTKEKEENLRVMSLSEEELDEGAEDPVMQYGDY